MAVYVDNMKAKFGRYTMCHMIADTEAELIQMAERIGVNARYHQHKGTFQSHFDIALSKRALAVKAGAVEIEWREYAGMVRHRQDHGVLCNPSDAIEYIKEKFKKASLLCSQKDQ